MLTACPRCGAQYALADEAMGRKGRCKECGRKFVVLPVDESDPTGQGPRAARRRRRAMMTGALLLALVGLCATVLTLWAKVQVP